MGLAGQVQAPQKSRFHLYLCTRPILSPPPPHFFSTFILDISVALFSYILLLKLSPTSVPKDSNPGSQVAILVSCRFTFSLYNTGFALEES